MSVCVGPQKDGLPVCMHLKNHIHHLSSDEEQAPIDFTLINATTYVNIISSLSLSCSVPKRNV